MKNAALILGIDSAMNQRKNLNVFQYSCSIFCISVFFMMDISQIPIQLTNSHNRGACYP